MEVEKVFYTKIESEIHNFVSKYGVDELIKWLAEYSKCISQTDYNTYHRIQGIVCEIYNIPIADINRIGIRKEYAEAKRMISYLTVERTKLKPKHVAQLQNCTIRSVNSHLCDLKYRLKNPKNFTSFMRMYEKTIEKLNNHA